MADVAGADEAVTEETPAEQLVEAQSEAAERIIADTEATPVEGALAEDGTSDEEAPAADAVPTAKPKDNRAWFVVHTYSGYENKVKANLERRIHSMGMQDKIFRVLVPMEDEVEFKDGKRKITPKKVFPGYVLVEMIMDDQSWYVVRNTQGVTGFVGSPGPGEKPVPLQDKEVKTILKQMGIEAPKLKIDFKRGDRVKVTSGPFFDFTGIVDDITPEKERLRALISIFGRETPVELEFFQVEKV
ncbi:MAG: transcription termination/antitermination protein NusG [Candidatus Eremiobacteraeota bacterium]|nr:transcription termination/antitermination protein NusG [Candidatus Eremiobacteraeota bacterium]MBV9056102.1 transcription termination/antitermination protein NusG [Candidatus Eremiobacteraeota bacterium]MBV9699293.1 transcription termination/antitermination protein NusG [Candidatus Eremiobacteraeota bacterium]